MKPFAIADPCHEDWNQMRPDAGARHCARCDKHVVDLASLSASQIRGLVRLTGGSFCGRQTIRGGELVVAPEPVERRSPFALRVVVGGAIMASALSAAACAPANAAPPSDPIVVVQVDPNPTPTPNPQPPEILIPDYDQQVVAGGIGEAPPTPETTTILFDAKSAKIGKDWSSSLSEVASVINASPWMTAILIEGHVSKSEAAKGDALALARANAVKAALVKRGVDAKRLVSVSRAYTQPLFQDGQNKTLEPNNRRVSFRICNDLESCR